MTDISFRAVVSRRVVCALLLCLAPTLSACERGDGVSEDADQRARGAAASPSAETSGTNSDVASLYAVCTPCHGANGVGTQLGPPLTGPEWIHIEGRVDEIERVIRDGIPSPRTYPVPMPPMGGGDFDDEQVASLAAYVAGLRAG